MYFFEAVTLTTAKVILAAAHYFVTVFYVLFRH